MAKNILALNIGSSTLTLASLSVDKKVTLDDYAVVPLDVEPGDENRTSFVLGALEDAREQIGAGNGPVDIVVPSQNVLARYVKLPAVSDAKKMKDMVKYEAEQIIPFDINEVTWDYQTLGDGGIDDDETLILAIKKEQIDNLTHDLGKAGLNTEVVDVAPIAIFNNFSYNYPDEDGCTLILDIGARSTDLVFVEDGKFFTRSVGVAGNNISQGIAKELDLDFLQAEQLKKEKAFVSLPGYEEPDDVEAKVASKAARSVMTRLHSEINRAINLYRGQQGGSAPERILLTGGGSLLPYLDEFLSSKLKLDVEHMHTFANVKLGKGVDEDRVTGDAVHLGEVIGLGVRHTGNSPVNINLMPETLKDERRREKQVGWLLGALALAVAACGLWAAYHKLSAGKRAGFRDALVLERDARKDFAGKITTKQDEIYEWEDRIKDIREAERYSDRWIRVLSGITKTVPTGTWIHEVIPMTGLLPDPNAEEPAEGEGAGAAQAFGANPFGGGLSDGPQGVIKVKVKGLAYTDVITEPQQLRKFLDSLALAKDLNGSNLFLKAENQITPRPKRDDEVRSFEVELPLATPIPIETAPLTNPLNPR